MTSNLHLRRGLLWAMDMLCRVLYLGSAILSLTSCVSITNAADGPTIGENANRFELAKYILTQQIKPLALKGMAGRQAIYTLLNKGYYCGVKTESVTGLNIDPGVNCIKQLSRYESRCDEFLLQLYFSPKKPKLSQIEFVNQLDAETVIGTTALCPYTPELSTDFVKYRGKAEAELRKYVRKTNVETERLDRAYEKLLMEKFYCGFAPNNDVKKSSASAPKLLCNTRSMKIEYCFEPTLLLDIEWSNPTAQKSELLREMGSARVKSIESSCVIPALRTHNTEPL